MNAARKHELDVEMAIETITTSSKFAVMASKAYGFDVSPYTDKGDKIYLKAEQALRELPNLLELSMEEAIIAVLP